MSVESAIRNRAVLLEQIGRAALNARYPKEFELYVCALELVDQFGRTLRYFIFPVNPSSLEETEHKITNIKKTHSGVNVLSNPTFIPVDISLSGNFGRKFRILLGTDYVDFINSFKTDNVSNGEVTVDTISSGISNLFDERVKTGYGCLQVLKDIVEEADVVDENGYRRLIFYNPAFGTQYIVKPMNFKIQMNQETNMVHSYYLQLKGIAPVEALRSETELENEAKNLNTTGYIQKQTDRIVNAITSIFK